MANLPTGTVSLLCTDIEASTRLLDTLGDAYEEVLATHRRLLRDAFTSHAGTEVDTQGDALFYASVRATDAVAAAIEPPKGPSSRPWPKDAPVGVRMGIHTGEPQHSAEGYVGHGLVREHQLKLHAYSERLRYQRPMTDLLDSRPLPARRLPR